MRAARKRKRHSYAAISDADHGDSIRPGLFPAAVRPQVFRILWVALIIALAGLGAVVAAYRHAIGG